MIDPSRAHRASVFLPSDQPGLEYPGRLFCAGFPSSIVSFAAPSPRLSTFTAHPFVTQPGEFGAKRLRAPRCIHPDAPPIVEQPQRLGMLVRIYSEGEGAFVAQDFEVGYP